MVTCVVLPAVVGSSGPKQQREPVSRAMVTCAVLPSSLSVVGISGRCHGRLAPGVAVASRAVVRGEGSAIQWPGCDSCSSSSSSTSSAIFGGSPSLYRSERGVPSRSGASLARSGRNVVCEVAVKVGEQSSGEQETTANGVQPGAKIRVTVPLTVFHVLKSPNLELKGMEGELKDVLGVFKGKPISANFPFKVQFVIEVAGKPVKFFAHLRDGEFEVVE